MYLIPKYYSTLCSLSLVVLLLSACSVNKKIARQVDKTFKNSSVVNQYHVGFALYDLANEEMIYGKNEDKYFTPASNTKLFTFYGGLMMLKDSIPSLRYVEKGDSLIFWGTGDPSFLQSQLQGTNAYHFLKNTTKKLFFSPGRYTGSFYGNGWSWDDYNDYYQAEINEFPVMGNLLQLKAQQNKLQVSPKLFATCLVPDSISNKTRFSVTREFNQNIFRYPALQIPENYRQEVPYKITTAITLNLLSDTLHKLVDVIKMDMPESAKTVYSIKKDAVLKEMMLPSDNFIAEQLLLVYANEHAATLSSQDAISYIQKNYLKDLPDQPIWVDGSGLSRGNLFTPRSVVILLKKIYKEVNNQERLFDMFPAGGKVGTLKNAYPATDKPFVFGKTGTLSNVHNQSGYVITKKGKIFLYAFMNNNFVQPTAEVRKEMGRIVTMIHERY